MSKLTDALRRRSVANLLVRQVEELETMIERLQPLAAALLEQRERLETMEEDYPPGLPERRMADDLLDAIDAYEAAKAGGDS